MKIKKFIIENYKAIKGRKEFVPDGSSFFLIGGNGQGKTSAGHAIMDILTKKFPSQPITEGEKTGYLEFILDDGAKLTAKLTEGKKPVMEFFTPDGYTVGSPRELFQDLAGDGMSFSIDDFLQLAPKPLREKLEQIAGLDLSDINEREADAFEARKLAKAQLRDQQGRVEPYDTELAKKEVVPASDIIEKLETLNKKKAQRDEVEREFNNQKEKVANGAKEVARMEEELENYIKHQKEKIEGVKTLLKATQQSAEKLDNELVNMEEVNQAAIAELKEKLTNLEEENAKITKAKKLHEEFEISLKLEQRVESLEQNVKDIRAEKEAKIKECPIPAEGVTFGESGEILIDGLPFNENQIATSRKIIAGIQIANAMLGKIKFLHFDGAALDKQSADQVLEYAEAHGLQLCIERPLWEGGELKFEIADHSLTPDIPESHEVAGPNGQAATAEQ